MKVAVILPSRGLVFSKTAEEVLNNLKGIPHKIYFAHKLPIPDCFNTPLDKALADEENTHIWFVEDDMVLPPTTLQDMLDKDVAVVTVNYPTTKDGKCAVLKVKGTVLYGGTGCTLVKRDVFKELKAPYFRDDIKWIPKNYGDHVLFRAIKAGKDKDSYGFHDVYFFMNLYRRGIPVHTLDYTVKQRKLVSLGKAGTNNGAHNIEIWSKIKEDEYFKLNKHAEEKPDGLIEIYTPHGNILAHPDHADRLIDKGLAERTPKKTIVLDDSEIL